MVALGDFNEDTLNASELGINQSAAMMVFDRAGWKYAALSERLELVAWSELQICQGDDRKAPLLPNCVVNLRR